MRAWFFGVVVSIMLGILPSAVQAASDEIEVYADEINAAGVFGMEQHLNYAMQGVQTPDYPGQMVSHHTLQATPELSYGLTSRLEAGLYLPLAFTADGYTFLNGLRARLKYIAPAREWGDGTVFYGWNAEAGRVSQRVSDSISAAELRPILGYRDARWLLSFNPILNVGLAAHVSHQPQFEPALKVARRLDESVQLGVEYYGTYGPWNHLLPPSQRAHTFYAVLDSEFAGVDANFGIGRGFVQAGDRWVLKGILEWVFK